MRIVLIAFALASAACDASGPSLEWANYAHNCGSDSDCVPITDVSGCECPLCPNRAINQGDLQQYQKDEVAYQNACVGTACSNMACAAVTAFCDNGTCQVK
ncbi:MAG TPA: hypothetical protein VGH28_19170 [Polyangiaceae bacterium]|jgi:hypothetical protein